MDGTKWRRKENTGVRIQKWLPLLFLSVTFLFGLSSQSIAIESITASASKSGACAVISDLYGRYFGTMCARGTASFTMPPLDGISLDWPVAEERNLCVLYALCGKSAQTAVAILYLETAFLPQGMDLETAASSLAAQSAASGNNALDKAEKNVTIIKYPKKLHRMRFAVRLLHAPLEAAPFPVQAKAYCRHNDAMLILTLAARSRGNLQEYMPFLHTLMDSVTVADLKIVPDSTGK